MASTAKCEIPYGFAGSLKDSSLSFAKFVIVFLEKTSEELEIKLNGKIIQLF